MDNPRGTGTKPAEVKGNDCTEWLAASILTLDNAGKMYLFENQQPDGCYPKVWDDPAVRDAIARTGAVIIPFSQCENYLRPSDQPDARYRKNSWLLVHRDLVPWAVRLWRRCSGQHRHVPLAGNVPGTAIRRTQQASRYTPEFAVDVLDTVEAAYLGLPPPVPPSPRKEPPLTRSGGTDACPSSHPPNPGGGPLADA